MENKEKKLCRAFCLSGVLGLIFYALHDIVGAANYPGYKWMSQAVSDLTATDAPSFAIAKGFSSAHGVLSVVCGLFVLVLVQNRHKLTKLGVALFATKSVISAIGYSLFPLSSAGYDGSVQSFIHSFIITSVVVMLSIVSLLLIGIGSFKDGRKALGGLAFAALALMFIGAVGSGAAPKDYFGIFERFSTYSDVTFMAVMGLFHFAEKESEATVEA